MNRLERAPTLIGKLHPLDGYDWPEWRHKCETCGVVLKHGLPLNCELPSHRGAHCGCYSDTGYWIDVVRT